MTIQRSVHLLGAAIALASGFALASANPSSACIYSSLSQANSGSLTQLLPNKINTNGLWQLGILASTFAAIGGGVACDLRRQRQAEIAAAEAISDLEFTISSFPIPIPPEALTPKTSANSPEVLVTR